MSQSEPPPQPGWTRLFTPTGRYEYQFQGSGPAVRNAKYEEARDYIFLVMDEEHWLYRIPVRIADEVEEELNRSLDAQAAKAECVRIAEAQLRGGLEKYRPRENAPYPELDLYFSVDAARAQELRKGS